MLRSKVLKLGFGRGVQTTAMPTILVFGAILPIDACNIHGRMSELGHVGQDFQGMGSIPKSLAYVVESDARTVHEIPAGLRKST